MEKLLANIHGTDAALLAVCYCIYQVTTARNLSPNLAHYSIQSMTYLGIAIVTGRVLLSTIALFREKRKKLTK